MAGMGNAARSRALLGAVIGAVVLLSAAGAGADSSFTFLRQSGPDRFATTCQAAIDAYNPNGSTPINTVYLANGLPGHQSDALAAPFAEANKSAPILFTDSGSSVPANTMTCLKSNQVKNIIVIGGPGSVPPNQVSSLQSAGYMVTAPYGGTSRFDTAQMVDETPGFAAGTSGGGPTGILTSGDDAHLIDAEGVGPLSFAKKFPVVLTTSTGCSLPSQSADVVSKLGLRKLIVVGGPGSVPTCQYQNNPQLSGMTFDTTATGGADRSATARLLADDEVSAYGLSSACLGLAAGATYAGNGSALQNDGADALGSAPAQGLQLCPLLITLNPANAGSADDYARAHAGSLKGGPGQTPDYLWGGNTTMPTATASDVATSAGGTFTTGQVTLFQSSLQPGENVQGQVENPPAVASLSVNGCGLTNRAISDYNPGPFSLTLPSSGQTGSCHLTFTATLSGGGTTTTTR
ncbi:MAG TPA: cell wall-binding repeat-containing protein [Acidimicrobiales bacterium]|nr:cell wall-binding repeat-containing protein [Acidimicrobiales bacterium]